MRQITKVNIEGLFGYANHSVDINTNDTTILIAPNGAGKTHILTLISAALSLDFNILTTYPYRKIVIEFDSAESLLISRHMNEDADYIVELQALKFNEPDGEVLSVNSTTIDDIGIGLPSHIKRVGHGRWLDARTGRMLNSASVERRFGVQVEFPKEELDSYTAIRRICAEPFPVLIDTKRLDVGGNEARLSPDFSVHSSRESTGAVTRINDYTAQLRAEVNEARRNSIRATQSADLSFAARALEAANMTINENKLHQRYDRTVERYEMLAQNALAVGDAPLDFPEKTTPTVRRILSVFLDDWDKRLEPLMPLNEKIQTLREILESKLGPSGKKTVMSTRGNLEFRTLAGKRIRVVRLSSGEQHLVALFTMLLFSARPGSIVLIDEPEISLHASWKHAFLDDIGRVAEIGNLQVIIATHSSAIINGRWDLTEELPLTPAPDDYAVDEFAFEEEESDDVE
ncbi:AAA family ATPase [Brevibacterium casei]|uniref:AAA family ATPase n=1 Tax=Brevibacterium casei TaxID=33889 RepID=UPI003EB710EF